MRKYFLRYFLSIFAIAVVVLIVQFGMLVLQYDVSERNWKTKVYDDFVVAVQESINNGSMAGYGLNSILYAVSEIDDDRISGFILRDISGTSVVAFGRTSEGGALTSVNQFQLRKDSSEKTSKVSKATRIDVNSSFNAKTNTLSLVSVAKTETKGVEISLPANLKDEGVIGSVIIAVDGTDAFIIDLLTYNPRTYKYSKDIINSCLKSLLISLPICLVIAIVAAWIVSSRNAKYINGVRKALNDLSHGKTDVSIPRQKNSELDEISVAIEDLDRNLKSNAKSRRAWLYSISHDLNTPTTAMKMIIDGLNDGVFQADEQTLRDLQKENDTLADRIGRVIDFSSLQADTNPIIAEVTAEQLAYEALSAFEGEQPVDISTECSTVRCDVDLMSKAVTELLKNAIEARGEADEPVKLSIGENGDSYEIKIVNAGKIAQEMDVDFFEPWARGDWSRSAGGSGLGLPIASAIMSLHKGTLTIRQIAPDFVCAVASWPKTIV
ncbi:MAG: HAMP domain-containing histidine kinase [Spirochaetales bacterium]|nr:HAMP domain-containing histidine kinase [Spirochaetales bacterium]